MKNYTELAAEYCLKMEWNLDAIPELAKCLEEHDQKNYFIFKIELREYPPYPETIDYFNKVQGWCNRRDELYFTDKQDVLKFIEEYIIAHDTGWIGANAKNIAKSEVERIIQNNMLEHVGTKYHDFGVQGLLRISKIRINSIDTVLNSPIVKAIE